MQFTEKSFTIPGPVGSLEAVLTKPSGECALLAIICHPHPLHGGSMTNKVITTIAKAYQNLQCATLRFNYRGVGNSQGSYAEGIGETEDLLSMLAWSKREFPNLAIALAGFSFGCYVCARAISENAAIAHTLWVAPAITHCDFDTLKPPACPWWVIQGARDEVVDPVAVLAWCDAQVNPPQVICMNEASHFFHGQLIELRSHIEALLKGLA